VWRGPCAPPGDARSWSQPARVLSLPSQKDAREVVAVKCVSKRSLNRASVENLLTEIEILKTIRHPHIVELKDFQWDSDHIYLIMEFCAGGDLSHFIRTRRILPEKVARIFLQQLGKQLPARDSQPRLNAGPFSPWK
uniref:non-specific serine/threonine protein kinase n=1 Tax=Dromaius novaehollandiae TaxID=8790 RepID=A0A8C4J243_DRONO